MDRNRAVAIIRVSLPALMVQKALDNPRVQREFRHFFLGQEFRERTTHCVGRYLDLLRPNPGKSLLHGAWRRSIIRISDGIQALTKPGR